jgi:signal transduction histidine kinase
LKHRKRNAQLLRESERQQQRLRRLTHACLAAQEGERKRISHRLHDDIAQRLLGIHVRLLVLQEVIRSGRDRLKKEIGGTQRLVRRSTRRVTECAHELGGKNNE